jgi:hypothetical protein
MLSVLNAPPSLRHHRDGIRPGAEAGGVDGGGAEPVLRPARLTSQLANQTFERLPKKLRGSSVFVGYYQLRPNCFGVMK